MMLPKDWLAAMSIQEMRMSPPKITFYLTGNQLSPTSGMHGAYMIQRMFMEAGHAIYVKIVLTFGPWGHPESVKLA